MYNINKTPIYVFVTDKNFNSRTPTVNVVIPLVRKPLTAPSKGIAQNRRFNSGKYF